MAIDPKTGQRGTGDRESLGLTDNYVSSILPMSDGSPLIGLYIGGVVKPKMPLKLNRKDISKQGIKGNSIAQRNYPKLPSPIKPPTREELKAIQIKLEKLNKPLPKVYAGYYGEDWKTQGDWIGRTFRDWAILCAVTAPFDHPIYFTTEYYSVHEFIGPHHPDESDAIRRWIHWIKTDNPKTLYDPWYGYRRQAEWDDHGEAYSWSMDGPDLWYLLRIREPGTYRIGMYFFNKDGHHGHNRMRDYMIEIYPAPKEWKLQEWPQYKFRHWPRYSELAELQVRKTPPLAKSRMHDFWGGVHKQFVVTGGRYYFVKIDRNYSFNTILSSVSVDRLYGKPTWHETSQLGIQCLCEMPYEPPPLPESYETGLGRQVGLLWKTLDDKYAVTGGMEQQRKGRIAAYQTATFFSDREDSLQQLADSLKWRLNQWDEKQRQEWRNFMKKAHEEFLIRVPAQRKAIEMYETRKK
jgi:hypothetical protein